MRNWQQSSAARQRAFSTGSGITPEKAAEILLKRRLARERMKEFTELTTSYKPARHHILLMEKLEALERGEFDRLLICMPPGHAKTTYTSKIFPAWYLGRNPGHKIISASHTINLAEDHSREIRTMLATNEYHNIFPDTELNAETGSATRWLTTAGGTYRCCGVGTGIAGYRAHLAIVDDPYRKQEDADSRVVREKTWNWWGSDLMTRLLPGAKVVLIQTRWHLADIAGKVLEEDQFGTNHWETLILPAFADVGDPMGRAIGEPLWPEFFSESHLLRIKNSQEMSSRMWSSLYEQKPVPEGGGILRSDWWKLWEDDGYPEMDMVVAAVDTATSLKTTADYSACAVFGVFREGGVSRIMLLHAWQDRLDMPALCEKLENTVKGYRVDNLIIEGKNSGIEVLREMRKRLQNVSIRDVNPTRDKIARAYSVQGIFESGVVYAPDRKWADQVIHTCSQFPTSEHDDMVDAVVHAIMFLRGIGLDMYRDEVPDEEEQEWQREEFQPLY